MLESLLTSVLSLEMAMHTTMCFLVEGQKVLFRFIYAILHLSESFILSHKTRYQNTDDFIRVLREHIIKSVAIEELLNVAFTANLKTSSSAIIGTRVSF